MPADTSINPFYIGTFASDKACNRHIRTSGWAPGLGSGPVLSHSIVPGLSYKNTTTGTVREYDGTKWVEKDASGFVGVYVGSTTEWQAALAAIGSGRGRVTIAASFTLTADITQGSLIELAFSPNAVLTVPAARTLSLQGPIVADPRQVFVPGGTFTFTGAASGKVYPEWWGAVRNDLVDDSTAIQAAVSALSTGGGLVKFLSGTYMVGTAIALESNVTLEGGGGTVLKPVNGAGINVITATGKTGVSVRNLEIDGDGDNDSSNYGVYFLNGSKNSINGCYVHDTCNAAFHIDTEQDTEVIGNKSIDSGRNGYGYNHGMVIGSISGQLRRVLIANNYVEGAYRKGIAVYASSEGAHTGTLKDVTITGNIVKGCTLGGIFVSTLDSTPKNTGVSVVGNVCSENGQNISFVNVEGGQVTGNTCRGSVDNAGIVVGACSGVTISGNSIFDSYSLGIDVREDVYGTDCINCSIVGNTIGNSNRASALYGPGIGITNSTYIDVHGNTIFDNDGPEMTEGIVEAATCDYCQIFGNDITGFVNDAVVVNGANTFVGRMDDGKQGVGTADPRVTMDIEGSFALRDSAFSLSNGDNDDVALATTLSTARITAPTANFAVTGLANGVAGRQITLVNYTGFTMTARHNNGGSVAANRILVGGGADLTVGAYGSITLTYMGGANRWFVTGYAG